MVVALVCTLSTQGHAPLANIKGERTKNKFWGEHWEQDQSFFFVWNAAAHVEAANVSPTAGCSGTIFGFWTLDWDWEGGGEGESSRKT